MLFDPTNNFDKPPQIFTTEKSKEYVQLMMGIHWNNLKASMVKFPHHEDFVMECLTKSAEAYSERAMMTSNKALDSHLRHIIRLTYGNFFIH
jgi:hypothetical protein